MNYKNLLKEQLLSEIITHTRPIKPYKIIIDPSKRKITRVDLENNETPSVKKGFSRDMLSKLSEIKRKNRKKGTLYTPGDGPSRDYDPPLPYMNTQTDIENSLESQRQQQRERRSRILRGEFNQSDLGTQPQKPYKKKFDLSLGFRKQNPDRTIY